MQTGNRTMRVSFQSATFEYCTPCSIISAITGYSSSTLSVRLCDQATSSAGDNWLHIMELKTASSDRLEDNPRSKPTKPIVQTALIQMVSTRSLDHPLQSAQAPSEDSAAQIPLLISRLGQQSRSDQPLHGRRCRA